MKKLFFYLSFICFYSCTVRQAPVVPFVESKNPPAPDYSLENNWAALPGKEDYADKTPFGVADEAQASAKVDVFYIHPTTFYDKYKWNADVKDQELNLKTDKLPIRHQASVFNSSASVYAPRYRQMVYGGFFVSPEEEHEKEKALQLAYSDIRNAFEYYLENYNRGRPIIIASHSQGTTHSIRLVKEFFDGKPLQKKLVAAYMLGFPFTSSTFKTLPVCTSPAQTGCVIHWATWKKGSKPDNLNSFYKDAIVVNPLNWTTSKDLVSKDQHKGFLAANYKRIKKRKLFAQIYKGILWVRKPYFFAPVKNYHVGDYNLFWMDIRENVALRVESFWEN